MPLDELDRRVAFRVASNFFKHQKPTSHIDLLRETNDPRPMLRLSQLNVLTPENNGNLYLPTILSYEYCGDAAMLVAAKRALALVVGELQTLFKIDHNSTTSHDPQEIEAQMRNFNRLPIPDHTRLGLFLATPIPGLFNGTGTNEDHTQVTSFRISDFILTVKPDVTLWNDYVRTHNPFPSDSIPPLASPTGRVQVKTQVKKSKFPGWTLERPLGEGGQGLIYLVKRSDGSDKASYVLKHLKNKGRLPRFQKEIAALQKLSHPGILRIVDTHDMGDKAFFVAEYCEGGDLSKANLSGKGVLSRLRLFREMCDAVAGAHSANVLHRDLKPQNILLRGDDSIVVGDFGLCLDLNDMLERFTATSEAVGARYYIAPEVEKGRVEEPGPSSDIYSLGKVLYFILSGRSLAREEYAEGPDDLRTRNSALGMHFIYELFDKTITERPQNRYQNMTDLLDALDSVINRIQMNAHILKPSVRQHCLFCVVGEYRAQRVATNEFLYVCDNCGNMQKFRNEPHLKGWWEQE